MLLLLGGRAVGRLTDDERIWRVVAVGFAVWALGPFLTVGGFDTGLKLPETLIRYVPFVANARMPGRAMVGVFMAVAVLVAVTMSRARGLLQRPTLQWLLIALVVVDFWDAPVPMTPLDAPAVYQDLAAAPPGAVCEAPFGVGDGLSAGSGSQDRRILFYATQHQHPLVGGYVGRMPVDAPQLYAGMPLVGALLRLSDGLSSPVGVLSPGSDQPCTYLIVNRAASSAPLLDYVRQLGAEQLATSDGRESLSTAMSTAVGTPVAVSRPYDHGLGSSGVREVRGTEAGHPRDSARTGRADGALQRGSLALQAPGTPGVQRGNVRGADGMGTATCCPSHSRNPE